jgi:hypothetical protein
VWCSLWGTDWILKYYLEKLRLQRFKLGFDFVSLEKMAGYFERGGKPQKSITQGMFWSKWNLIYVSSNTSREVSAIRIFSDFTNTENNIYVQCFVTTELVKPKTKIMKRLFHRLRQYRNYIYNVQNCLLGQFWTSYSPPWELEISYIYKDLSETIRW